MKSQLGGKETIPYLASETITKNNRGNQNSDRNRMIINSRDKGRKSTTHTHQTKTNNKIMT